MHVVMASLLSLPRKVSTAWNSSTLYGSCIARVGTFTNFPLWLVLCDLYRGSDCIRPHSMEVILNIYMCPPTSCGSSLLWFLILTETIYFLHFRATRFIWDYPTELSQYSLVSEETCLGINPPDSLLSSFGCAYLIIHHLPSHLLGINAMPLPFWENHLNILLVLSILPPTISWNPNFLPHVVVTLPFLHLLLYSKCAPGSPN